MNTNTITTTTPASKVPIQATAVQIAHYINEKPEKPIKYVARLFKTTSAEVRKVQDRVAQGKLLKKRGNPNWNTAWEHNDVIFHPNDHVVASDMLKGEKESSLGFGLLDPDYDPVNGGVHVKWSEDDVENVLASLPYTVLGIMRDCKPSSEAYQEAVLFLDSDLFLAICKKFGLDAEIIAKAALEITKADM